MKRLHLSSQQRHQLERQLKSSRDVRLYRRTLAILEYDRGRSVTEISRMLRVSRPSVYRRIERYRQSSDPDSLLDEDRWGRGPAWTEECSQWLQSFLRRSPAELGYYAGNWTVPLLRDPLEMRVGKRFCDHTIRRALSRLDYVWKRPRYVLPPDPERGKKGRPIRRRIRHLPRRSVLLVEDETDLLPFALLRANWSRRGEPARVLISGCNARRVVFGAMNPRTGEV